MAADDAIAQRARRTGLGLLQPLAGLAGLSTIMSSLANPTALVPLVSAAPVDWQVLLRASRGSVPYFFADVAPEEAALPPVASTDKPAGTRRRKKQAVRAAKRSGRLPATAQEQPAMSEAAVREAVMDAARGILGTDLAPTQPLMEAGLDSLGEALRLNACLPVPVAPYFFTHSMPGSVLQALWSCAMPWGPSLGWSCPPPSSSTTPVWQPWRATWRSACPPPHQLACWVLLSTRRALAARQMSLRPCCPRLAGMHTPAGAGPALAPQWRLRLLQWTARSWRRALRASWQR